MKTVAIGDIHGREIWESIVKKESDADRIVFIGDYFDSFDISAHHQLENFRKIVDFKQKNVEKVVMLIGNHDFHYMPEAGEDRYSGYNEQYAREIWLNLQTIRDQMKIVHIEDGYLFSHAGVTQTWMFNHGLLPTEINAMPLENLRYERSDTSGYGNHKAQSPIWVRPEALVVDAVQEYVQVAGHTRQKGVAYYEGKEPTRLVLIDCHDSAWEYLIVEDGVPRTGSL